MIPVLSIVIICRNLESYIVQAVTSALIQNVTSQEIIVVDNNSSDSSLENIADLQAASECRFEIIKNLENLGPGLARNQGIEAARGRYIAFLDGDDWIEGQGLSDMVHLAEEIQADVTVFNHQQVFMDGHIEKNRHTKILWEGDRSAPESRKELLRNYNVAWNKLYRAEFLYRHGLRFPEGFYEDVDVTHRAIILADRCAASDQVVVNYRKDRQGSITNSHGGDHMQVIDRFRDLLQFAEDNRELCAPYRTALFERVVRNSLTLLNGKQKRLPLDLQPEFLRQISELFDVYDPHREVRVGNANILVYRALRSGNIKFYNTVKRLNGLRFSR